MLLALVNITRFIMLERQKNKFLHPLVTFYVWIVLDFVANIVWEILIIKVSEEPRPLIVFLPATFKVLIGVE